MYLNIKKQNVRVCMMKKKSWIHGKSTFYYLPKTVISIYAINHCKLAGHMHDRC